MTHLEENVVGSLGGISPRLPEKGFNRCQKLFDFLLCIGLYCLGQFVNFCLLGVFNAISDMSVEFVYVRVCGGSGAENVTFNNELLYS